MTVPKISSVFLTEGVRTPIYRGITGVPSSVLQSFVDEIDRFGSNDVSMTLKGSKHPWWTLKSGLALAYAVADNVSRKSVGFDLLLVGELTDDLEGLVNGSGRILDLSKSKDLVSIPIKRVIYVESSFGSPDEKKSLFLKLLDQKKVQ